MSGALISTLAFISCGKPHLDKQSSNIEIGSIVNGKNVTIKNENAQSIVGLVMEQNGSKILCTGSIIESGIILTAAHCIEGNPQSLQIVFGVKLLKTKSANTRQADKMIQHPNWGQHLPTGEGDLALIHFKGNLPIGYHPANLATPGLKLKLGQKTLMMGYGVTDGDTESGSGELRETNSTIINRHSSTEILSDGQKSGVCFGDSGGPAFVKINDRFIQWGVASSVTNRSCNEASIHTELMKYLPWIHNSIIKLKQ